MYSLADLKQFAMKIIALYAGMNGDLNKIIKVENTTQMFGELRNHRDYEEVYKTIDNLLDEIFTSAPDVSRHLRLRSM